MPRTAGWLPIDEAQQLMPDADVAQLVSEYLIGSRIATDGTVLVDAADVRSLVRVLQKPAVRSRGGND